MDDSDSQLKLYRLLFENSLGLMCIHDLNGVLLSINPAVANSLGYELQEGPGRSLRDFLVPSVRPLFDDYLRRIRMNGSGSGLMRLLARDGTERIWMYRNTLYEPEGSPPCVLGHALDITERVRAEQALRKARAELRKANEELAARVKERTAELEDSNERLRREIKHRQEAEEELLQARKMESLGVLAGGIAHDFNNLLTIVQGNLELARMQLEPGEPAEEILDQTAGACERAAFLASQLLTFAKGGSPVRRTASVAKVVSDAVNLVRGKAVNPIEVDIAGDLWPAEIDAGQIGHVLVNILRNAQEAAPGAGAIRVSAENVRHGPEQGGRAGAFVRISLRDSGAGIPADILPRIFDPYFTTKPAGSGLGLATAYAIVSKHGGRISVQSAAGQGTTFLVELPALTETVAREFSLEAVPGSGSARILIMDDEEALRTLLKRALTALGHEAECARDGAEAIAMCQSASASGRPFDAVLLDLTVAGGMSGVEAAARLRESGTAAKLIVSSGYSGAPVLADFRDYGFDDVLPKPWSLAQLRDVFRRVLARDPDREDR